MSKGSIIKVIIINHINKCFTIFYAKLIGVLTIMYAAMPILIVKLGVCNKLIFIFSVSVLMYSLNLPTMDQLATQVRFHKLHITSKNKKVEKKNPVG